MRPSSEESVCVAVHGLLGNVYCGCRAVGFCWFFSAVDIWACCLAARAAIFSRALAMLELSCCLSLFRISYRAISVDARSMSPSGYPGKTRQFLGGHHCEVLRGARPHSHPTPVLECLVWIPGSSWSA